MTRKSGFSTRGSGGELQIAAVGGYRLRGKERLALKFQLPSVPDGEILGFGGWFFISDKVNVTLEGFSGKYVLTDARDPNWAKFGSQWYSKGSPAPSPSLIFTAEKDGVVAVWDVLCGRVYHEYLQHALPALMTNMHAYAPEANFIDPNAQGTVNMTLSGKVQEVPKATTIYLKSCNRCTRFLPINIADERLHLSFTNHCVAEHRRPCSHSGFGRLTNVADGSILQLEYGYQLECRFCKKFEVNAAHNPLRTAGQMKEDAQRRRSLELLTEQLYGGTPQLRHRHETGRELAEDIWEKFEGRCFKCGTKLASPRDMHLDHTRPLALLWPLDGTATALCATHNSEKRDRPPVDFYSADELVRLSEITGIPLAELKDPSPNLEAIELLREKLEWFFQDFLIQPRLTEVREGKIAADLVVKALQKTLNKVPGGPPFDLQALIEKLQQRR